MFIVLQQSKLTHLIQDGKKLKVLNRKCFYFNVFLSDNCPPLELQVNWEN